MSTLMPLRVLIVEDQPADAELILHYLRKDGFDPDWQRVETEAKYRLLFANNPLPMSIFDLETRAFLAVNTTALHHYGYSLAEFLQLTVEDICPSLEVPPLVNQPAQMMSGPGDGGVWTHRKKDGTRIEVETAGHRLTFRTRPAWLGLAVDVTER